MDEAKLVQKLQLIEALFSGATTPGERDAAGHARERIMERLREVQDSDPPIEFRFTMADRWSRQVFVALLRRYDIRPYRYRRQRHTTVQAMIPKQFVDEILWPQFEKLSNGLQAHLSEVTDRVVAEVLEADGADAEIVEEPRRLSLDTTAFPAELSPVEAVPPAGLGGPASESVAATVDPGTAASGNGRRTKNRRKRDRKKRRR